METELISPWTLYWILRLDTIHGIMITVQIFGYIAIGIGAICLAVCQVPSSQRDEKEREKEDISNKTLARVISRKLNICFPLLIFISVVYVLTPTTRQAAVIYALPALVNNQQMQSEAGEVYSLRKQWFTEQVEPNKEN